MDVYNLQMMKEKTMMALEKLKVYNDLVRACGLSQISLCGKIPNKIDILDIILKVWHVPDSMSISSYHFLMES